MTTTNELLNAAKAHAFGNYIAADYDTREEIADATAAYLLTANHCIPTRTCTDEERMANIERTVKAFRKNGKPMPEIVKDWAEEYGF